MARRVKTMIGARALSARVIRRIANDAGARSPAILAEELARASLNDPRDRALATELTYGVLRWQRRLDHALKPLVRQRLSKLEHRALDLLRVGAYQLLFLDRIPAPVAVSATQDAARQLGAGRLAGLLNGVLRKLASRGEQPITGDTDSAIGLRTSLPDWVVAELRRRYGQSVETEAAALRQRAATTIRPTLAWGGAKAVAAALAEEGFACEPGPHGTLIVSGAGDPFGTRAFAEGGFVAQDPASLAVVELLGDLDGKRVLDLCAGRGIKASAMADRGARVTALDVGAQKLASASALADKLGLGDRVETRCADGTSLDATLGLFDVVLVDAPCTGLGTLRRHPEIAWRRVPGDIEALTDLQTRLLANGARHVGPGGLLCYAVCTFTEPEIAPATPPGFEPVRRLDLAPSSGLDAFTAIVYTPREDP